MKLGPSILSVLALLTSPSLRADEVRLDEVVGRAEKDLNVRTPFEDHPLSEHLHRAQIQATGAAVSIAASPRAGVRVSAGPLTAGALLALVPRDERILVCELTGDDLTRLLERAASTFAPYSFEEGRPLRDAGASESLFVSAHGVSYEIDLTAAPGQRVLHLNRGGAPIDSTRRLEVAMVESLVEHYRLRPRSGGAPVRARDAWLAYVRDRGTLTAAVDHNWSLLPDFAAAPERPLIDRLVRLRVAPPEEAKRLVTDQLARRGDLAYWLARAYGWREAKLSGAFPDVADSLEPWLDGLIKRRVIGPLTTEEYFQPFALVKLPMILDWCEQAAREGRYALTTESERQAFRRGLLTGTSLGGGRLPTGDTVTVAQMLGVIANLRFPEIRILATTDLHGALTPRDTGVRPRGGSPALAAHLNRLRAENPEGTVLLDGGDAFQGTMISNLRYGRPVVEHMNRLGYAAMAIGNHEFDWSQDTLARRASEMRFATLGANILEAKTGKRPWWARNDTLLHRRGVRLGVFGLGYPRTPTATHPRNVKGLLFEDDSATAVARVPALRRRGAEAIVGLGHIPGTSPRGGGVGGAILRLARGVPGVDLWLGGHSHTRVEGDVEGIPALIPGSHGEIIAVCDLVVDPLRDRVVGRRHSLVDTWVDEVVPDSTMVELVERWGLSIASEAMVPIGVCATRLKTQRGRESPIGSLVADVVRDAAGADVALQNNGGLRAELPEGPLTRGSVYAVIPFENEIYTMELTGGEIRRVLEEGLATERVVQVSGIRYRFDLGRRVGSRVTALLDEDGRPLDEGRTYKVACNDFMASGGDDLVTLTRGRNVTNTGMGLREAVEESLRERCRTGPLDYQADGRVTREPGSPPPARGD